MEKILKVTKDKIFIGTEKKEVITVKPDALNFDNPKVGDLVEIYGKGENRIISRCETSESQENADASQNTNGGVNPNQTIQYVMGPQDKTINKHVFVWICSFFFGVLGVDRFARGQVGYGIFKLLSGGGCGIWWFIDWLISVVKAYGQAFGNDEYLLFILGRYAK